MHTFYEVFPLVCYLQQLMPHDTHSFYIPKATKNAANQKPKKCLENLTLDKILCAVFYFVVLTYFRAPL
ncbi:MAG: hypothetical protein ACUVT9_01200, partial [Candidatus Bathycorpusculaceae bacterium]